MRILKNNRNSLYWAGLATGLIAAIQLVVLAGYGVRAYDILILPSYATAYLVPLILQMLIVLLGVYIAWRRPVTGSIILVAASLLAISHIAMGQMPPDPSDLSHLSDSQMWISGRGVAYVDSSSGIGVFASWWPEYLETEFIVFQMCLPSLLAGVLVLLSQQIRRQSATHTNVASAVPNQRRDLYRSAVVVGLVYGCLGAVQFIDDSFWIAAVRYATPTLLIGLLISWKWPVIGGFFLVIMGLFLAIHHALYDYFLFIFPHEWLIFALPLIGIGIIFLLSARKRYIPIPPPPSSA